MQQKLILVTGATGFVGAYVVKLLLQKGYRVRGLRRPDSSMQLLDEVQHQVEWAEADITDIVALEDAFNGVTHVCHCAASISFHPKAVREMHQTNVVGTANVVNMCLHNHVQHLIHVSSIAALGRSKHRLELDEKCQWVQSPDNSAYAVTKHLAEQEVWRGMAEGLQVTIVSPSVVVGSRNWEQGMAAFFGKIDNGLKVYPSGKSGFVDVRDVASCIELVLSHKITGERYILNAVNLTHHSFFSKIAAQLSVSPPTIKIGPFLMEIVWRLEWLKEKLIGATPLVTRESARASVSNYQYRNEKSLTIPGFQYRDFDLTLREMAAQYQIAKTNGWQPETLPF
jgi:nucleoside-diphosphate-sugar epimerase